VDAQAQDAKNKLDAAKSQFGQAVAKGTTRGTNSKTEIVGPQAAGVAPSGGAMQSKSVTPGRSYTTGAGNWFGIGTKNVTEAPTVGQSRDEQTGESTRGLPTPASAGGTNAGNASMLSRFASLGGGRAMPGESGDPLTYGGRPAMRDSRANGDITQAFSLGQANDNTKGYGGPADLKASMGDAAYSDLQDQLRKAQEAAKGLQDSGGIASALGYTGNVDGNGMAAMDAGLAGVAGANAFRELKRRYGGLGGTLAQAEMDSRDAADAARATSAANAADWQKLLGQYDDAHKPADDAAAAEANARGAPPLSGNKTGQELLDEGFTQEDLDAVGGELTADERKWLNSGNGGDVGHIWDTWANGTDTETIKQNIIAKMIAARRRRNGEK
jgi:hypothetical protein